VKRLSISGSTAENLLIHGDNLVALASISQDLAGSVRCCYMDPPYNNQERYSHYDDRAPHELWLAEMRSHLELVAPLLRQDGSLWISIDDRQMHYLKVVADEVLGRDRFVTTIVWEHRNTRENRKVFSNNHEYLLVYAADPTLFRQSRNLDEPSPEQLSRYRNPDDDPRGDWQSVSLTAQAGHGTQSQFYAVTSPNGTKHFPPKGRCWVYNENRMSQAILDDRVWFGKDGCGVPRLKRFLADGPVGLTPETLWKSEQVGTTTTAKKEILTLFPEEQVFDTPKPESLLHRILSISTDPGDLVLDSYLGSGTTAAVAHKMGRQWLGIEVGDHATSLCRERLNLVIAGENGGISGRVGWTGGGDFDVLDWSRVLAEAA